MKRSILFACVVLCLALLCSCTTGTDITKRNRDGSPIWTKEIPTSNRYLYGVGKAKLTMDSNSQQAADAAARADLALKINVNIDSALTMYTNEASGAVASAYETLLVQSVNITMKKVVVEQRWTAPDGTVWSLVSFRIKDLPDLYADAANDYLNQLEERRISTLEKLEVLLKELKDSTDDVALEIGKQAQDKANSIIYEIAEVYDALSDVSAQVGQLVGYLSDSGFELE